MKPRKYATTSEAEIRALVEQGLNFPRIAERLNVNLISLRNTCSVLGIRSADKRGRPDAGRTVRSLEELQAWVRRLEAGETTSQIAKTEGCTRNNIGILLKKANLPTGVVAAVRAKVAATAAA